MRVCCSPTFQRFAVYTNEMYKEGVFDGRLCRMFVPSVHAQAVHHTFAPPPPLLHRQTLHDGKRSLVEIHGRIAAQGSSRLSRC